MGKKKVIIISVILCILLVSAALFFVLKDSKKDKEKVVPDSNDTNTNTNTNVVNSDDISIIIEDVYVQNYYGNYFEVEFDDEFSIVDIEGKVVVKNPLYLSYAIASEKPVYQGKDLAVHATYDSPKSFKVYKSTENMDMGYVVVFEDTLAYKDTVKNYYLGDDILLTISMNKDNDENIIVKYNIKTGEVISANIVDGYLSLIYWNGKPYLADSHTNLIELDNFTKVFQKNYILGDGNYTSENDELYSASNKYMTASLNGKYGVIDASEKVIVPFNYLKIEQIPNRDIMKVQTNTGYGLLNNRNQVLLDARYDSIEVYDDYTVVVDQNGILRILNNKYESLFTASKKMKIKEEVSNNAIRTSEKINKDWNILKYSNMIADETESPYYVIFGVNNGKIKEFLEYRDAKIVYNSPTNYGYVALRTDTDIVIYDGIVERSKVNISDYSMAEVSDFIYLNDTYITFVEGDGKSLSTRYFINMKTNKIETQKEANVKESEIPSYNIILDSKRIVKYKDGRVNIYDFNGELLLSMVGHSIHKLDVLDGNFYEITNDKNVSIIRIK